MKKRAPERRREKLRICVEARGGKRISGKMNSRKLKVAIIGLGGRSEAHLAGTKAAGGTVLSSICDKSQERISWALEICAKYKIRKPKVFTDHREILADPSIDAVIVSTMWNAHIPVALDAMNAGKYVGIEVGGATSIEQL